MQAAGGIINSKLAARLAEIFLEPIIESEELHINLPFYTKDCDDMWFVWDRTTGHLNTCSIQIRKRDGAILTVNGKNITVDILHSSSQAEKFAKLVVQNLRGEKELQRQLPFSVVDQLTTWLIKGRPAVSETEGPGPCHLEVEKHDARLVDLWFDWLLKVPPEAKTLPGAETKKRESIFR